MKKKPARVVSVTEPVTEAQGNADGQIDACLRVAEARVEKQRRMREAIIASDTAGALVLACELVGFSDREAAARVEVMLAAVTRSTQLDPKLSH
jgi:hypothetical protein